MPGSISDVVGRIINFLREDKSLSLLLFTLVITLFVIYPMAHHHYLWMKLLGVFISLNFLSGLFSLSKNTVIRIAGVVFSIIVLSFSASSIGHSAEYRVFEFGLWIAYFAMLSFMILLRIFTDNAISYHRIQGAIAVYIIFGLMFSFVYAIIFISDANAFSFSDKLLMTSKPSDFNFVYFSFVTLCTLGYGDITPVSHIAQSIVILEALTGILFPAILIARLVSLSGSKPSGN